MGRGYPQMTQMGETLENPPPGIPTDHCSTLRRRYSGRWPERSHLRSFRTGAVPVGVQHPRYDGRDPVFDLQPLLALYFDDRQGPGRELVLEFRLRSGQLDGVFPGDDLCGLVEGVLVLFRTGGEDGDIEGWFDLEPSGDGDGGLNR